jgi:hypothetical protein
VVSILSVTRRPACPVPSQNCWPQTPRFPLAGHDAVDLHRSQGGINGGGRDFLAGEGGRVDRGLEVGIRVGFVVGQPSELGRGPERQDGALLDGGSG